MSKKIKVDLNLEVERLKRMNNLLTAFIIIFFITFFGAICNNVAVMNNEGRMPVKTYYYIDTEKHFSYGEDHEVKHPLLTDRINIKHNTVSIGDILMFIGAIGMVTIVIMMARTKKVVTRKFT